MYRAPDSSADLSIICDADTLLIERLPEEFLEESIRSPAVSGVIAHVPPPLIPYPDSEAEAPADHEQLWARLASTTLGRPIATPYGYTLLRGTERAGERCPFYINHGFIAAPPGLMAGLSVQIEEIIDRVRSVLDNDFAYQLAIPYALERGSIPHRTLPMRFNFPNDPRFDQRYPVELDNILLVHYLRTRLFDRHTLFTDEAQFARFMTAPLKGSNHAFRDAVRRLSGGRYPFREGL
jgi:hypothetical protein